MCLRGSAKFHFTKVLSCAPARRSPVHRNCGNLTESQSKLGKGTLLPISRFSKETSKSFFDFSNKIRERNYSPLENIPAEILSPSIPEVDESVTDDEICEDVVEEEEELEPEKKYKYLHNCIVLLIRNTEIIERIRNVQRQLENFDPLFKFSQIALNFLHITTIWLSPEAEGYSDHCQRTENCMEEVAQTLRLINFRPVNLTIEGVEYMGGKKADLSLAASIRRDENWQRMEEYLSILNNSLSEKNIIRYRHIRETKWNKKLRPHITFQRMRISKKFTDDTTYKYIQIPDELFNELSSTYFGVEAVRSFDLLLSKKLSLHSPLRYRPRFPCDFVSP